LDPDDPDYVDPNNNSGAFGGGGLQRLNQQEY